MKIKDIIKENLDGKAVITKYQPGKSVEVTMPDGTLITKDLVTNPSALSKDEQGNPIFNLATSPQSGTAASPQQQKPISTGTQVDVNTDPNAIGQQSISSETMGETHEEEQEDADLIGSGKDGDIGGDPTDELINNVVDTEFERSARGKSMSNKTANARNVLPENDELNRWLTIARLR